VFAFADAVGLVLRRLAFAEAHMVRHDHPAKLGQGWDEVTVEIGLGPLAMHEDEDVAVLFISRYSST
jgi:hypothetical protein